MDCKVMNDPTPGFSQHLPKGKPQIVCFKMQTVCQVLGDRRKDGRFQLTNSPGLNGPKSTFLQQSVQGQRGGTSVHIGVQGGGVVLKKSSKRRERLSHLKIPPPGFLEFYLFCTKAITKGGHQVRGRHRGPRVAESALIPSCGFQVPARSTS